MERRSGPLAPGIAFITGGARGLGNAIAVSFAKEGASGVVLVDILQGTLEEGKKKVEAYGTKARLSISASLADMARTDGSILLVVPRGPSRCDEGRRCRECRRESRC